MENTIGSIVLATAGRDQEDLFFVVGQAQGRLLLADGKRLPFYVSEFSYSGYRLKEKGTLTYRGDRLLKFE